MPTEQEYLEAQKIVNEWVAGQPNDPAYPSKPKGMSLDAYLRRRALNEVLRFLDRNHTMSNADFLAILSRFELTKVEGIDKESKARYIYVDKLDFESLFKDKLE